MHANFVVVLPASIPRNTSPSYVARSPFSTIASECLFVKSSYSLSFLNNGSSLLISEVSFISAESFAIKLVREINISSLIGLRQQPIAAKR